jgi:hypothetical protein
MSLSHDVYATFDLNRFSGQPTGQCSDYDQNYDIHEASLRFAITTPAKVFPLFEAGLR